jgi:GNAT superfamily N-acetyltransferase
MTERLKSGDIHEATEVIVEGLTDDPVWTYSFPHKLQRQVAVYSIMAAEIQFKSRSASWVHRGEDGKIASVLVFEDNSFCYLCDVFLQTMAVLARMFYYPFKKIAREVFGSVNPLTFLVAFLYSLITLLYPRWFYNMIIYGCNYSRIMSEGKKILQGEGFTNRLKHLFVMSTLPTVLGQGIGGKLMEGACKELKDEDYYEGYYLESTNPRNVSFFERNLFVNLGEGEIGNNNITFMLRTEDRSALTKGDSVHIMKSHA